MVSELQDGPTTAMEVIMLGCVPKLPTVDRSNPTRSPLLVLGGASMAAVMMAWVAFLLWLATEGLIAIMHWL